MKTKLAIIGAACLARAAFAVTMASQPWTANRIAEAEARVAVKITAAINAIPAPDFSQNNAQLRETIVAVSPPADLTEATNHTRAALSAFAGTGTVERARSYGTPTRWTDATGCVWRVVDAHYGEWSYSGVPEGFEFGVEWLEHMGAWQWTIERWGGGEEYNQDFYYGEETDTALDIGVVTSFFSGTVQCRRIFYPYGTNLVGRTALTNDIPRTAGDVSAYPAASGSALESGKQDRLPYPTNAIPYAAISGAPSPQSVFYDAAGGAASVSGATLTYQAASNSVGSVALLAGTNVLHITAPSAITGHVRDFGLTVSTEDAATITLDQSVSWRFDAASTNLSAGSWNRVYCTESPSGVFSLQLWTPDSAQEATP